MSEPASDLHPIAVPAGDQRMEIIGEAIITVEPSSDHPKPAEVALHPRKRITPGRVAAFPRSGTIHRVDRPRVRNPALELADGEVGEGSFLQLLARPAP